LFFRNSLEKEFYYSFLQKDEFIEISKMVSDKLSNTYIDERPNVAYVKRILNESLQFNDSLIKNVKELKNGMTNFTFRFEYNNSNYVIRIPKEPSKQIINRQSEADVYESVQAIEYVEENIYLSSSTGIKISKYIDNARVINPQNLDDIKIYAQSLKSFHQSKIVVDHEFDILRKIYEFEKLVNIESIFSDYKVHKKRVLELYSKYHNEKSIKTLCHIDSNYDNYLLKDSKLYFIDFEYSGMADPLIDLAMFSIYASYDKNMVTALFKLYYKEKLTKTTLIKLYILISLAGLLWSNWCGYYDKFGYDFNEYWLNQYNLSKKYYTYAVQEISSQIGNLNG
jgi:thiamine kinase-like enzyme